MKKKVSVSLAGFFMIFIAVVSMFKGYITELGPHGVGDIVTMDDNPVKFWLTVAVIIGFGGFLIYISLFKDME